MKGRMFTFLTLIVSVSLLLALGPGGAVLTVAQSQPASLVALVPAPATPVAAPTFGKLPLPTLTEDNRLLINDNKRREHPDHFDTYAAVARTEWDDADSHKWIGEAWGADAPSSLTWGRFHGRDCLEIHWDYPAWLGYIHTDTFPDENWESPVIGLRADVYVESNRSWTDIGIEPRDHDDSTIELLWGNATDLMPNQWHTVSWYFTEIEDYHVVAGLVFKLDQLGNYRATVCLDNIRLITATGETEWDDMDDQSHWWAYGGNWYNWAGREYGLELISHNCGSLASPVSGVFLQWDYEHGEEPGLSFAEIQTPISPTLTWPGELNEDWSGYNRISTDVRVSDPDVPISVFFWDTEGSRGFGTPTRKAGVADSWQSITWDLPWPPWFDNADIDQIKFVVNNTDVDRTGTLCLDNVFLVSDTLPIPVTGLEYIFENFNDRDKGFNDFNGNCGELNGDYIATTFDASTHAGTWGASLRIDYDLPSESFTGIWQSVFGHSTVKTKYLDFTNIYGSLNDESKDFEQIHFWVRGSGTITGTHNIKVEVKDIRDAYEYTAYRYITIDDSDTAWREVVLDAHVTNSSFWSYNLHPPDPTRMKFLVFIVESYFNNPTGTFHIDDIHFVDADDGLFDLDQHTDDEFLDFVSEKTFLYFLDWYDQDTGLFQDRSTFPDLMSTAATGFGLTALAIGDARGWISHDLATEMASRTLNTLYNGPQGTAITGTMGYKGFFYHFLDTNGWRKVDENDQCRSESELSSVDTALLMAGVLTVREYFSDTTSIRDLANSLYQRVEWAWMLRQLPGDPDNDRLYLGWKPEYHEGRLDDPNTPCNEFDAPYQIPAPGGGYFSGTLTDPATWDYYTDEAILINLLAIGSPIHPVPSEVFYAWAREWGECEGKLGHKHRLIQSWNGSFFTYVFAHLWVDFSILGTDNHPTPTLQPDWWENSVEAARCNWQFAADHQDDIACDGDDKYTTYGEHSWGLTASDGPDGQYHAYGALPAAVPPDHDGTIQPYGAGMAVMLLPEKATLALKHYFANTDLWRYRFGFGDSYNLDPPDCNGPWYNHAAFGIDQGPMLIGIENYRSGLIWTTIVRNSDISRALDMLSAWKIYLPLVMKIH